MRMRTLMVTGIAALFAIGTSVLPLKSLPTADAADHGISVARFAALQLEPSSPIDLRSTARYQAVADALAGPELFTSEPLSAAETRTHFNAVTEALTAQMLTTPGSAGSEMAARYLALGDSLAGRGPAGLEPAGLAASSARYQAVSELLAGQLFTAAGPAQLSELQTTARYQTVADALTGRDLPTDMLEAGGAGAQAALAEAGLAMAPLAEHETEEDEDQEDEDQEEEQEDEDQDEDEGETYESENYDYTITFDANTWEVIDEQSSEDDAGHPVDFLSLGAEFGNTSFWGVTVEYEDSEECVEALAEAISDIEGVDDAETQDDVDGDEEDASVVLDYEYTFEDGETVDFTAFLRCQTIEEEESYLQTWFDTLPDLYEDTEDAREELLDGVEIG